MRKTGEAVKSAFPEEKTECSYGLSWATELGNLGFSSHGGAPPLKYEIAGSLRWKLQVTLVSFWDLTNNAEESGANRDEKTGSKPRGLGWS